MKSHVIIIIRHKTLGMMEYTPIFRQSPSLRIQRYPIEANLVVLLQRFQSIDK